MTKIEIIENKKINKSERQTSIKKEALNLFHCIWNLTISPSYLWFL